LFCWERKRTTTTKNNVSHQCKHCSQIRCVGTCFNLNLVLWGRILTFTCTTCLWRNRTMMDCTTAALLVTHDPPFKWYIRPSMSEQRAGIYTLHHRLKLFRLLNQLTNSWWTNWYSCRRRNSHGGEWTTTKQEMCMVKVMNQLTINCWM
jgi:hypothetical protein